MSDAVAGTRTRVRVPAAAALAAPVICYMLLFFAAPFLLVVVQSFAGQGTASATLDNYVAELTNAVFWKAVLNTVLFALWTVLLCSIIAVPYAWGLARHPRWRGHMLALLLAPLVINGVVRIYGLEAVINAVNTLLMGWHVISTALPLNFSPLGVVIGLVTFQFPFVAISVYASLVRVDASLVAAARTLGANGHRMFLHVVIPAAVPGLVSGGILAFTGSAGSYILPAMMGGGRIITLPQLVYTSVAISAHSSVGAAIAILLAVLLAPFLVVAASRQRAQDVVR